MWKWFALLLLFLIGIPLALVEILILFSIYSALTPPQPFFNEHWKDTVITNTTKDALLSGKLFRVVLDESPIRIKTYGWKDNTFYYQIDNEYFSYNSTTNNSYPLSEKPDKVFLQELSRGEMQTCGETAIQTLEDFPWVKDWKYDGYEVAQGSTQVQTKPYYPQETSSFPNFTIYHDGTEITPSGRWCIDTPPLISPDGNYVALLTTRADPWECVDNFKDIHTLKLKDKYDYSSP